MLGNWYAPTLRGNGSYLDESWKVTINGKEIGTGPFVYSGKNEIECDDFLFQRP
jgi:hypothetical protein